VSKQKDYYKTGTIIDPVPVMIKAQQVAMSAETLTEFEAKFLKETLHACVRFAKTFRMSDAQKKVLEELWTKHHLPKIIDTKTVKEKPCQDATAAIAKADSKP
jgi:hypothetical protein